MKTASGLVLGLALVLGWSPSVAQAQKGVGDPIGVARQGIRPKIVTLTGKLVKVETGPCEMGTGWSPVGTHLVLAAPGGDRLNVHLGPEVAVADTVAKLSPRQKLTVRAFRTEKLKKNHYVATALEFGETTVRLRDQYLQPVWAGGNAGPRGPGAGWGGGGWGRGRGYGAGYRWRRGGGYGRGYGGGYGRGYRR